MLLRCSFRGGQVERGPLESAGPAAPPQVLGTCPMSPEPGPDPIIWPTHNGPSLPASSLRRPSTARRVQSKLLVTAAWASCFPAPIGSRPAPTHTLHVSCLPVLRHPSLCRPQGLCTCCTSPWNKFLPRLCEGWLLLNSQVKIHRQLPPRGRL